MFRELEPVTLRDGRQVGCAAITTPDADWAPRLLELLGHKGDLWNEQNRRVLVEDLPLDAVYYVLHRDGDAFCNILVMTVNGVGMLGHVYTRPDAQRNGAAKALMQRCMDDVKERQVKALFLGTWHDTHPYHLYRKFGFEPVEPGSGYMHWYAQDPASFEAWYFAQGSAPGAVRIEPLGFDHWVTSPALTLTDLPGQVKFAGYGINARVSTEQFLLPAVLADPPRGAALVREDTKAVVGMATWNVDPLWPATVIVDVYCHPNFWDHAQALIAALDPPRGTRQIAYGETGRAAHAKALRLAGFTRVTLLPDWLVTDAKGQSRCDVNVFVRG